jgi:SAM-dependent MidA family methyltransferase
MSVKTIVTNIRNTAVEYAKLDGQIKELALRKQTLHEELKQTLTAGQRIVTDYGEVVKEEIHSLVVDDILVSWLKVNNFYDKVKVESVPVEKIRALAKLEPTVNDQLRTNNAERICVR